MKFNIKFKFLLTLLIAFSLFTPTLYAAVRLGTDGSGQGWFGEDTPRILNSNGKTFPSTTAGLKAAIYDLNSTDGGRVSTPQTTITISSAVQLISNLSLDLGETTFQGSVGYQHNFFELVGINNVTITGGYFIGDNDTTADAMDDALQNAFYVYYDGDATKARNIIIRDVRFHDMIKCIGLWGIRDSLIENNWCDDACWYHVHGHAIYNTTVRKNTILHTDRDTGFPFWSETKNCIIEGNTAVDTDRYGMQLYPSGGNHQYFAEGTIIRNNYVVGSGDHGIRVYSNRTAMEEPIIVQGNVIKEAGGSGIRFDYVWIEIFDNVINESVDPGIDGSYSPVVVIKDNMVKLSSDVIGIGTGECLNQTICGNYVKKESSTGNGIQIGEFYYALVSGNIVDKCTHGIYIIGNDATLSYGAVEGNVVFNYASYGLYVKTLRYGLVMGNLVSEDGTHGLYINADANNITVIGNVLNGGVPIAGTHANIVECFGNVGFPYFVVPTTNSTAFDLTGKMWFDPAVNELYVYNGTNWVTIT